MGELFIKRDISENLRLDLDKKERVGTNLRKPFTLNIKPRLFGFDFGPHTLEFRNQS